jgi:hypothetical protein
LEQGKYLKRYLLDGRLEISNNRAERSIKPFVIDRKDFLFANTPGGARASAVAFSIIETAKENGLNRDIRNKPEGLRKLLPDSAPAWCKAGACV